MLCSHPFHCVWGCWTAVHTDALLSPWIQLSFFFLYTLLLYEHQHSGARFIHLFLVCWIKKKRKSIPECLLKRRWLIPKYYLLSHITAWKSTGFILVFNRKSGDVQSESHRRLQISPTTAWFRTHQGEHSAVARIITCKKSPIMLFLHFFLFVAHRHCTIRNPIKTCAVKHSHINWLPCYVCCLACGDTASPSGTQCLHHKSSFWDLVNIVVFVAGR